MKRYRSIPRLIAPQRRGVQWLCTLVVLGIPFLQQGGESLLRFDASSRTLLLPGGSVRIEEFYLLLIAVLILVFGFLLVTMVLGRVWCGWFCPQSTLSDLAEGIRARTGGRCATAANRLLRQVGYLTLSLGISANLIWYFIAPGQFLHRLAQGTLGPVAEAALAAGTVVIYLNLALVRREFCRSVCPYGRIQLLTMDGNTLTLRFKESAEQRCLQCGACARACPMGIDVRKGLQIECINCGRCVDACSMARAGTGGAGLIRYGFGDRDRGGGAPLNGRTVLFGGLVLLLCATLVLAAATRREATLKLQRGGNGAVRFTPDGSLVNFYTAFVENRDRRPGSFSLRLNGVPGTELVGPVDNLTIPANENRRVDFAVKYTLPVPSRRLRLRLERNATAVADALLPAVTSGEGL